MASPNVEPVRSTSIVHFDNSNPNTEHGACWQCGAWIHPRRAKGPLASASDRNSLECCVKSPLNAISDRCFLKHERNDTLHGPVAGTSLILMWRGCRHILPRALKLLL